MRSQIATRNGRSPADRRMTSTRVRACSEPRRHDTNKELASSKGRPFDRQLLPLGSGLGRDNILKRFMTSSRPKARYPRSFSELVTSQLVPAHLLPANMAKSHALTNNMGVDYVLVFRFATTGTAHQSGH